MAHRAAARRRGVRCHARALSCRRRVGARCSSATATKASSDAGVRRRVRRHVPRGVADQVPASPHAALQQRSAAAFRTAWPAAGNPGLGVPPISRSIDRLAHLNSARSRSQLPLGGGARAAAAAFAWPQHSNFRRHGGDRLFGTSMRACAWLSCQEPRRAALTARAVLPGAAAALLAWCPALGTAAAHFAAWRGGARGGAASAKRRPPEACSWAASVGVAAPFVARSLRRGEAQSARCAR